MNQQRPEQRVVIVKSGGAGSAIFGGIAGVIIGVGVVAAIIIAVCAGSLTLFLSTARQDATIADYQRRQREADELKRSKDPAAHAVDTALKAWPESISTGIAGGDTSAPSTLSRDHLLALRKRLHAESDQSLLDQWVLDARAAKPEDAKAIGDRFRELWKRSGGYESSTRATP